MTTTQNYSQKLQSLINERPLFHKGETEIERPFDQSESMLTAKDIRKLSQTDLTCYGIGKDVLQYIAGTVGKGSKTLETGAGCSTLVFAFCGCDHIAVTPAASEITLIKQYAAEHQISLDSVKFEAFPSELFLPRNEESGFDMVLLDGKHAFPWPIVDWFYTADKLKKGGLMLLDDAHMKSVSILVDFLKADTGWSLVFDFSGKTVVFRKERALAHDVAWHMQKYTAVTPINRLKNRIRHLIKA